MPASMVTYDPPAPQPLPFVARPSRATPVTAAWLNHVHAVLADLAGPDGRIPALEVAPAGAGATIYATNPPTGLDPIVADGTADDSARLQAMIDYLEDLGGGTLDYRTPGATIKCGTGLVLPTNGKVQLLGDEGTLLNFPALTGAAITVNDADFTPLVGVRIQGPNSAKSLTDPSIGVSVTGVRLRFYNCRIRAFGRGWDWAHSETWLISAIGGDVHDCGTCVYLDNVAASATNAGEQMLLDNVTLFNSSRALHATGNGVDLKVSNCSIDYCAEFGTIADAWVYFTACHLETRSGSGGTPTSYMFNVTHNSKVFFSNADIIAGAGDGTGVHYLFNSTEGPWNYNNGRAFFSNTKMYFVDTDSIGRTAYSEHMVLFPASETEVVVPHPFPGRWCLMSAEFASTDNGGLPGIDLGLRISDADWADGTVTLTAAASHTADRWARVRF